MTKLLQFAFLIALSFHLASAQVPEKMSYQGLLTKPSGDPVSDGDYTLLFRLYAAPKEGDPLWSETQSLTVIGGIVTAILGDVTPLELPFDVPYWLGITVQGDAELIPRTPVTASAYSLNSRGVTGGNNVFPAVGNVGVGTTRPVHPLTVNGRATVYGILTANDTIRSLNGGFQFPDGTLQATAAVNSGGGSIITPDSIVIRSTASKVIIMAGGSRVTVNPDGTVFVEAAADMSFVAANDLTIRAGRDLIIEGMRNAAVTSGQAFSLSVGGTMSSTISGGSTLSVGGNFQVQAGQEMAFTGSYIALTPVDSLRMVTNYLFERAYQRLNQSTDYLDTYVTKVYTTTVDNDYMIRVHGAMMIKTDADSTRW
jgi:hypothetical protein